MTYSLILRSLEPKLTRQELEEISTKVPSVARADCAYIARDWFGIISSSLELDDAREFQAGLRAKGCETDVVADNEIPALHEDFRCQRITLEDGGITLRTSMGRRYRKEKSDLVFIAAAGIDTEKLSSKTELKTEMRHSHHGSYPALVTQRSLKMEEKKIFRIDLFFTNAPHRISLETSEESVIFYGERLIRLKNTTEITVLMIDLQALVPPERTNQSLRELSVNPPYPTMHAYEEELRWAFYHLGAKG